jgi:hypothetical protein
MIIAGKHTTTADEVTAALWEGWGITSGTTWFVASVLDSETDSEEGRTIQPLRPRVDDRLLQLLSQGPFLELPGRRYVLLSTSTTELTDPAWPLRAGMGWAEKLPGPMPQLIWPADHAWAITPEIDFDSTLVGGAYNFINEIMNDPAMEAVRVEESTDLTWDADDINRPS